VVDVNAATPAAGNPQQHSLTPPGAVKLVAAKGSAVSMVIAQLTEISLCLGAVWLRSTGSLSEDNLMIVFAAVIVGPAVGRIRGVPPVASIVTMLAFAPAILPYLAKKGLVSL